jgi:uncharacterized protein (TIGR03382 family)
MEVKVMVYCQRCGKQNEDGAQFCNKCGASLTGFPREYRKSKRDEECEEDCAAQGKSAPAFWGVIVLLVGVLILIEILRNIPGLDLPQWFYDFNFWWVIGLVIALAIIIAGFRMLARQQQS